MRHFSRTSGCLVFRTKAPTIARIRTLALLIEPRRLDARLSDVHFIEPTLSLPPFPPCILAYTLVFRKHRSANTKRTKRLKHVDRAGCSVYGASFRATGFLYAGNS